MTKITYGTTKIPLSPWCAGDFICVSGQVPTDASGTVSMEASRSRPGS